MDKTTSPRNQQPKESLFGTFGRVIGPVRGPTKHGYETFLLNRMILQVEGFGCVYLCFFLEAPNFSTKKSNPRS